MFNRPLGMNLTNADPINSSPFNQGNANASFNAVPAPFEMITETGDNIISETGDFLITE